MKVLGQMTTLQFHKHIFFKYWEKKKIKQQMIKKK